MKSGQAFCLTIINMMIRLFRGSFSTVSDEFKPLVTVSGTNSNQILAGVGAFGEAPSLLLQSISTNAQCGHEHFNFRIGIGYHEF